MRQGVTTHLLDWPKNAPTCPILIPKSNHNLPQGRLREKSSPGYARLLVCPSRRQCLGMPTIEPGEMVGTVSSQAFFESELPLLFSNNSSLLSS